MKNKSLVSIIIPVYNGSDYVKEAIDSALSQTYPNIEIIVVNDGSNDGGKTEAIALSYGDKIKYISKPNGGVSSALNAGISQMNGEYFAWLSHDDKYTKNKIESQVNLLKKNEDDMAVVLCSHNFIDKNSKIMELYTKDRKYHSYMKWDYALTNLFEYGTFSGCAFLIPKKFFDEVGGFDERLRFAQDTLMWAKMFLSKYSIIYDENVGVLSRVHASQQTHKLRHLIASDSAKIAEYLVPRLIEENQIDALYFLAKRNAKLNNLEAFKICIRDGKIPVMKKFGLYLTLMYGKIRPLIRKIYYALFKHIKTG